MWLTVIRPLNLVKAVWACWNICCFNIWFWEGKFNLYKMNPERCNLHAWLVISRWLELMATNGKLVYQTLRWWAPNLSFLYIMIIGCFICMTRPHSLVSIIGWLQPHFHFVWPCPGKYGLDLHFKRFQNLYLICLELKFVLTERVPIVFYQNLCEMWIFFSCPPCWILTYHVPPDF